MLKASFILPNGTSVTIEGAKEDIRNLLDYYSNSSPNVSSHPAGSKLKTITEPPNKGMELADSAKITSDTLTQIINTIKTCPEADAIERNILAKDKPAEADRVLLPLYIVHEYFENAFGLTTVEIETITTNLGPSFKVNRQNANRQFVRTSTSRYVLGDKTRKTGTKMRYTLNDRGVQYMKSIIEKPVNQS